MVPVQRQSVRWELLDKGESQVKALVRGQTHKLGKYENYTMTQPVFGTLHRVTLKPRRRCRRHGTGGRQRVQAYLRNTSQLAGGALRAEMTSSVRRNRETTFRYFLS